jgi:hypothetical protein
MKKRTIMWLLAAVSALVLCGITVSAQPGDNSDPVVTKSYIDKVVTEIKDYINEKLSGNTESEEDQTIVAYSYEVVNVPKGKQVVFGASTEFILRAGSGTIFASKQGGIADVTAGEDLGGGKRVPQNHLLIVPRDDGRGFTTESETVIMVKGIYSIQ